MLPKRRAATAATMATLTTLAACAPPVQANTPERHPTGRVADLPAAQTVVHRHTVTKQPTVVQGEKLCADRKPDLAFWDDPGKVPERWRMARIIWEEAQQRDAPPKARVIAFAAAIQESNLEDMPGGHADSQGIFQMRGTFPDQWGTYAQLDSPKYQADRFFTVLFTQNRDWRSERVTVAAQDVLRSAFPTAYADHVDEAARIIGHLSGMGCDGVVVDRYTSTSQVI